MELFVGVGGENLAQFVPIEQLYPLGGIRDDARLAQFVEFGHEDRTLYPDEGIQVFQFAAYLYVGGVALLETEFSANPSLFDASRR